MRRKAPWIAILSEFELAVAENVARFLAMLDNEFKTYGVGNGLPFNIRDAVQKAPRHRFVHRFFARESGQVEDFDAEPLRQLARIYSDQPQTHVNGLGEALPSSNSQPSYVLWLVHMLALQSGHRVLEIGSGSGWLAAIMARLVGHAGHVTGVEIIADLAERSRKDLQELDFENVTIIAGDGTRACGEGASYDRAIITAATWDLPPALFDCIVEGGRILIPIAQRGGGGCCHVTLLRRVHDRFVAERIVPGAFVPLVGPRQTPLGEQFALEDTPFWPDVRDAPTFRCPLWLAEVAEAAMAFRTYLGQTDPNFVVFDKGLSGMAHLTAPFGLVDTTARSLSLCQSGELICYGTVHAARRLASAYARWTELGLPGPNAFELEIVQIHKAPEAREGTWVEQRGDSALVWRLKPGGESWRALLDNPNP